MQRAASFCLPLWPVITAVRSPDDIKRSANFKMDRKLAKITATPTTFIFPGEALHSTRGWSTHLLHMWGRMQGFSWTIKKESRIHYFNLVCKSYITQWKYWKVKCWAHLFTRGRGFKAVILQQMSAGWLCSWRSGWLCSWRRRRAWTKRLQGE